MLFNWDQYMQNLRFAEYFAVYWANFEQEVEKMKSTKNSSNTKSTKSTKSNCSQSKGKGASNCSGSKKNSKNSSQEDEGDPQGSYTGNPIGWGKYAEPVQDADDL